MHSPFCLWVFVFVPVYSLLPTPSRGSTSVEYGLIDIGLEGLGQEYPGHQLFSVHLSPFSLGYDKFSVVPVCPYFNVRVMLEDRLKTVELGVDLHLFRHVSKSSPPFRAVTAVLG